MSFLHCGHDTGILVPAQQRTLAAPRCRLLNVCPTAHEFLVARYTRQSACHCAVDVLHDVKIGGKEDVKITLMDLSRCKRD